MKKNIMLMLLLTVFCFGCGESSTPTKTNDFGGLQSIEIFPEYQPLANNTESQMTAIGIYYDEPARDITNEVLWASGDETIATISSDGMVQAHSAGNVLISATLDGQQGMLDYQVVDATIVFIDVIPLTLDLPSGLSQQYIAFGTFADVTEQFVQDITSSVAWSTVDQGVAVIDDSGLATATGAGTTDVEAIFDNLVGSAQLTVF